MSTERLTTMSGGGGNSASYARLPADELAELRAQTAQLRTEIGQDNRASMNLTLDPVDQRAGGGVARDSTHDQYEYNTPGSPLFSPSVRSGTPRSAVRGLASSARAGASLTPHRRPSSRDTATLATTPRLSTDSGLLLPATTTKDDPEDDPQNKQHVGVPLKDPATGGQELASPVWNKRPFYQTMLDERSRQQAAESVRAQKLAKESVEKSVGPYAETEPQGDIRPEIKFGRLRFEETGRIVPYLIIPERVRDADDLLQALKTMHRMNRSPTHDGKALQKPNTIFDVGSSNNSYLSWAKEVYDNDTLSEAWGWHSRPCKMCEKYTVYSPVIRGCSECGETEEEETTRTEEGYKEQPLKTEQARLWSCASVTHDQADADQDVSDKKDTDAAKTTSRNGSETKKMDSWEASREFMERLLHVTGTTLASLAKGKSWLFTAAGRDAAAQLFGDAIQRFNIDHDDPLNDLIWMQYASLRDPKLFGKDNHEEFVAQLKHSAVNLNHPSGGSTQSIVHYPSNRYGTPARFFASPPRLRPSRLRTHQPFLLSFFEPVTAFLDAECTTRRKWTCFSKMTSR